MATTTKPKIGDTQGKLTIVALLPGRWAHQQGRFWCFCACGGERWVSLEMWRHPTARQLSCGCLRSRPESVPGFRSSEWRIWRAMRTRCRDKNATGYARYGGRGISVCERWQTFANFFFDMGYRPSDCHTLDRINNDGNYDPANVRWALRHEQNDNRALTAMLTIKGKTKPLPAWARENGLHPRVLRKRIASGYPEKLWLLPKDKFPRKRLPTAQPKLMLTKDGCTKSLVAWSKELNISRPTLYDRIARGMTDDQVLTVGRVPRRF